MSKRIETPTDAKDDDRKTLGARSGCARVPRLLLPRPIALIRRIRPIGPRTRRPAWVFGLENLPHGSARVSGTRRVAAGRATESLGLWPHLETYRSAPSRGRGSSPKLGL
jgi:hypothetical protein